MAQQLPLPLPSRSALGREDFYVSPANQAVIHAVEDWPNWAGGKLALFGPPGTGKSHLAFVFAAAAGARVIDGQALESLDLDRLAQGPLAVDCADQAPEEALFHLYNLMHSRAHPLLLTAQKPPARWQISLPDLASRLETIPLAELGAPDDALLTAVLAKHFSDRGIAPPAALIPYLVARIERSMAAAADIVDQLDRVSLADAAPIGVRLASRVLDKNGGDDA